MKTGAPTSDQIRTHDVRGVPPLEFLSEGWIP